MLKMFLSFFGTNTASTANSETSDPMLNFTGLKKLASMIYSKFVKQEEGKSLSSNDFTDDYVQKISELEEKVANLERLIVDCVAISDNTTA